MRQLPIIVCVLLLLAGCMGNNTEAVDRLNEKAYAFHYRDLDSVRTYANKAIQLAGSYTAGRAEALNNLAFVEMAAMRYKQAQTYLDEIGQLTDNQIELLIANVQQMKLCQKQSHNKDFYVYSELAKKRLTRIKDEEFVLNAHEQRRLAYASSEYHIVASAYYYYIGLESPSAKQLKGIDPYGSIQRDTAQLLNYWYNIGAGGILTDKDKRLRTKKEMQYLAACYRYAIEYDYPYWEAQALQSISEHLQDSSSRREIINDNFPIIVTVNTDMMPDSLIAGNLAQRALNIFKRYGDVYQTAGAWRTLGECYWHIDDNNSALICLEHSLKDSKKVEMAPDLIASIREDLCLVYSAINDKRNSDINRNIYLDLQEQTRQDRQLEARASQLDDAVQGLNILIVIVMLMILMVVVLLVIFTRMRRRSDEAFSISKLLKPLSKWKSNNEHEIEIRHEQFDEIKEATDVAYLHLTQNRKRNLEQRAKVQLVCSILPLIDRMVNEINRIRQSQSNHVYCDADGNAEENHAKRLRYVEEITDSITEYNSILTKWIQMRQGELSLRIENFRLQQVFDMVSHSSMGFTLGGIRLIVKPTDKVIKADPTLTLFMVNTIADNARKFTPKGGSVTIEAKTTADRQGNNLPYIEISVSDTGKGMTEEVLSHVFDRTYTGGHGFGLKNCKGIIEKYKKTSSIFKDCMIAAESTVGKGSRIFFWLPSGKIRTILFLAMLSISNFIHAGNKASEFADSAYLSNIMGKYEETLRFADSCHKYIDPKDTVVLLDVSNEAAVAALALHRWDVYKKNNNVYTRLFRLASADSSLPSYISYMQRSKTNKMVSVVLLIILLLVIFPSWYFLYYRHKLNYKFCVERINHMNDILLSDMTDKEKHDGIVKLANFDNFNLKDEQKAKLQNVVERILSALKTNIEHSEEMDSQVELAIDECHRIEMEAGHLHISNSVLDNCLSTLKHETMYYPSRIKQMISNKGFNIDELSEVVTYYHDLYAILAEQALRQVPQQRANKDTYSYMLSILKKSNGNHLFSVEESGKDMLGRPVNIKNAYIIVRMAGLDTLTDSQVANLFTPYTVDLNMLLCRQIVREMGEVTNLRACGIQADKDSQGHVFVKILIPKIYLR